MQDPSASALFVAKGSAMVTTALAVVVVRVCTEVARGRTRADGARFLPVSLAAGEGTELASYRKMSYEGCLWQGANASTAYS